MQEIFQWKRGGFADWLDNGPWRSKSVRAALAAVVVGLGLWVADIKTERPQNKVDPPTTTSRITAPEMDGQLNWSKPLPFYVRMGASYVAAYCIGWLFRRVLRLILVVGALGFALIGLGKLAGWDMTRPQEQIRQGSEWTRLEAGAGRDYLKGLLPSATAGAAGIFMGFRRRRQNPVSEPAV